MPEKSEHQDEKTTEALLRALKHPMRRRIMELIAGRTDALSPREAATAIGVPLSRISYHFRCLAKGGFIAIEQERSVRGAVQHFYLPAPGVLETPLVATILGAAGEPA